MAQVLMKYLKVDDFENYQVQRAIQDVSQRAQILEMKRAKTLRHPV